MSTSNAEQELLWDELERQLELLRRHDRDPGDVLSWLRTTLGAQVIGDHQETGSSPAKLVERRRQPDGKLPRCEFAWESPVSRQLYAQIERVANVDSTIYLTGESGTGKSTMARMIHERSARRGGPFVAVNCGSLPRDLIDAELFGHAKGAFTGAFENRPGRAEAADGGTLFLDEIGDLPLELQPKLLTFLQERNFYRIGSNRLRNVDVRVISATHANLLEMSAAAEFRRDLFFRLAVLRVQIPSLRERVADIRPMAMRILNRIARAHRTEAYHLSEPALRAMERYSWPGNIRELENVLENAAAFAESTNIQHHELSLPTTNPSAAAEHNTSPLSGKTLAEVERELIICALQESNGNKAKTARALGISLRSVYNKMHRHGLVISKSLNEPCE